ncbi:MAG: Rieske 2Fe-2S domain-containing protein [Cyanobacteria bacterium P01_H01_bin.26]
MAEQPVAATLLNQRPVIWHTSQGISVANDFCLHRGVSLSTGHIKMISW